MLSNSSFNPSEFFQSFNCNYMTKLPVIDNLLKEYQHVLKQEPLKNTVIVYVHHPLQTSINVISSLIMLGAHPTSIYILGKSYSENKGVVQHMKNMGVTYIESSTQTGYGEYKSGFKSDIIRMWNIIERSLDERSSDILVLDHGGHAISSTPESVKKSYRIIGIEKTTAGTMHYDINNKPEFPIINVAGCAAKRLLESPLIAHAVASKVEKIIASISQDKVCAVIGFGAIGKSVASVLENMGKQVLVYDKNDANHNTEPLEAVIEKADYIFGCAGVDITYGIVYSIIHSSTKKTFLSCSSEDKEFLSLLKEITKDKVFSQEELFKDIKFNTANGGEIILVKGGFPVNFDDSGESVPASDIQLTRALVVGSVIDAIQMRRMYNTLSGDLFKLSAKIQQAIVTFWFTERSSDEIPSLFNCTDRIAHESFGIHQMKLADDYGSFKVSSAVSNLQSINTESLAKK